MPIPAASAIAAILRASLNPSTWQKIRLGDVERALTEQVFEFPAVHKALAGSDRHLRFVHDLFHSWGIAGLGRFLYEQRPVRRQRVYVLERNDILRAQD